MNKRLLLYLIPVILPISLIQAQPQGFGIFGVGDPQCDVDSRREAKKDHINCILKIVKGDITSPDLKDRDYAVAFPGDLIDGQSNLTKWRHFFWLLQLIPPLRKGTTQRKVLESTYLEPLDKANIPTMTSAGNHDFYDATASSLELLKKRDGKLYYTKKFNKLLYVCCGVYPDGKVVLPWLKKRLAEKAAETPVVIAFHYNILDNHNRWWTIKERQQFMEAIKGKNVQVIFHGHVHETYTGHIEGIPVVCSGGDKLPVSLFDANGIYQKTIFLHAPASVQSGKPAQVGVRTASVYNTPATPEEKAECEATSLVDNDYF